MTGLFSENPQDAAAGQSNAVGDQLSRLLRKAATQEDLDRVIKDITDLVKLVDAWPGLRTAAQRLRQMAAQHRIIDSNAQVFRRAETLLRARTSGFTTSEQAKAFLGDLNDQVGAIEIVVRSSRLREEGVRQWALLTPVLKEQLARWNPERFWSAAIRLRATKQELLDADVEAGLIECIREITAHLVFVRDAIAAEFKGVMPTGWAALLAEVDVSAERLARTTVLDVERMRAEAHEPVEWPDPRMVLERVRAFDTREFVISSAVAILAFLLVLYIDKNFGTFWSYLSALLAGLSGALIINWQLLPWYRKYVSVISAKP